MTRLISAARPVHRHWTACVLGVAMLASLAPTVARAEDPITYEVLEEQARAGTRFRRPIIETELVALNRPYAQLPAEDIARLKAQFEGMGPDDRPPFPVDGLWSIVKNTARNLIAKQNVDLEGPVWMNLEVDADGKPTSISVLKTPDEELARYMANIAMRERYEPARCNGKPCAGTLPLRFDVHIH